MHHAQFGERGVAGQRKFIIILPGIHSFVLHYHSNINNGAGGLVPGCWWLLPACMWACVGRDSAQIRLPVQGGPGVGGMLPVHQEVAGRRGEKRLPDVCRRPASAGYEQLNGFSGGFGGVALGSKRWVRIICVCSEGAVASAIHLAYRLWISSTTCKLLYTCKGGKVKVLRCYSRKRPILMVHWNGILQKWNFTIYNSVSQIGDFIIIHVGHSVSKQLEHLTLASMPYTQA